MGMAERTSDSLCLWTRGRAWRAVSVNQRSYPTVTSVAGTLTLATAHPPNPHTRPHMRPPA